MSILHSKEIFWENGRVLIMKISIPEG